MALMHGTEERRPLVEVGSCRRRHRHRRRRLMSGTPSHRFAWSLTSHRVPKKNPADVMHYSTNRESQMGGAHNE